MTEHQTTSISDKELRDFLEKLEHSNAGQEKYARRQYRMSQITAAASIAVLCIVLYSASTLIPKINLLLDDVQSSVSNIQVITQELAEADLPGMIDNVDHLVTTSESTLQTTAEKLNSIDFETLNDAITDLSNIIRPLGRWFGK